MAMVGQQCSLDLLTAVLLPLITEKVKTRRVRRLAQYKHSQQSKSRAPTSVFAPC